MTNVSSGLPKPELKNLLTDPIQFCVKAEALLSYILRHTYHLLDLLPISVPNKKQLIYHVIPVKQKIGLQLCVCVFRPVFEGCFSEEPLPYSDPTGAAGGGNCRLDSPSQESRLQTQRIRGQDSRGHGHTPQNRPHGHQPPDLPEGYGQSNSLRVFISQFSDCCIFKVV